MATDFFDHQDRARRQTQRFLVLFLIAVALIIVAVYAVATGLMVMSSGQNGAPPATFDPGRFGIVATAVLLVITSGSLYKTLVLSEGGEAIARMLGGRLLEPSDANPLERRLLNVVEEMALAAGTPVPPVYLMDNEPGINAFAAGFTPGDAVIGVSRGGVEHLTRDELQGVIGHEFSHILNGDMKLNLRLIGVIHGILVIALIGQIIFRIFLSGSSGRSYRRRDSDGDRKEGGFVMAALLAGAALFAIGSIGVLFGRIIKCAISRQREFLADASAVQFTRNPDGIAGALKKIGGLAEGSRVQSPNAEQACHMFFGQGVASFARLLATHPPLDERIRRLDPMFTGVFPQVAAGVTVSLDEGSELASALAGGSSPSARPERADATRTIPLSPESALASIGAPTPAHVIYATDLIDGLPQAVLEAARDPFSARAILFALLLDHDPAIRELQLRALEAESEPGTAAEVVRLAAFIEPLGRESWIPLVDLTFPALRRLSPEQYRRFRADVDGLVRADQRVSLFEYAVHRMILRQLGRAHSRQRAPDVRYSRLDPLLDDCAVLVSTLARLGHDSPEEVERSFVVGVSRLQQARPGERAIALAPPEACTLQAVDRILGKLAAASPNVKRAVLDACASCIASDGLVTPAEGEMLRAVSDALDCPMPPLLPGGPMPPR